MHPAMSPIVDGVVRFEAFRAPRPLHLFGYDRADICQEMRLHLLTRLADFDGRASMATFAAHVCRNRALQLVAAATSVKRGGSAVPRSLSEPVKLSKRDGSNVFAELADIISDDGGTMRTGRRSRSTAELMILCLDVDRVVHGLPAELADVAHLLGTGMPRGEVAQRLGISRATLHRRTARLRCIFRQAGLDKYMGMREAA